MCFFGFTTECLYEQAAVMNFERKNILLQTFVMMFRQRYQRWGMSTIYRLCKKVAQYFLFVLLLVTIFAIIS